MTINISEIPSRNGKVGYRVNTDIFVNAMTKEEAARIVNAFLSLGTHDIQGVDQVTEAGKMIGAAYRDGCVDENTDI
jgi:hypothetical protein